jgi:hypothetical protein
VNEKTRDQDIQQYELAVWKALAEKLKKAFPEEDFRIHGLEFGVARERYIRAA